MPELLKSYVVRNAEQLTPKQVSSAGILSHPARLQSARYQSWMRLCDERRYTEVQAQMTRFLDGDEAIRSIRQMPGILRKPLEFAESSGYRFTSDEFLRHVNPEELRREFGELDGEGRYRSDNAFKNAASNVADQLIAEAKVASPRARADFDKQAVLKTLHLVERVYASKQGKFGINVQQLYASPVILPACLIDMDPCRERVHAVAPPGAPPRRDGENRCECKCKTECVPQNPCCAKITPYVADLYVVRDELRCYEVGEMSYIQNVLQSEICERVHRTLEREELTTEQTEESTVSEMTDLQVDERFSLHTEVEKSVEQELSIDAGVTANQSWGSGDVTATTNVGFNQSRKEAQKSVQDRAKQVIQKSVTSLERKVREFASRKLFREAEETNRHVFGGTAGAPADISRQYYYVNAVWRAQVFNWGRRTLVDLYLPEPSELYKRLVEKQFKLKRPEKPAVDPEQITDKNFLAYVKEYGLKDFEMPPKMTEQVHVLLNSQYAKGVPTSVETLGFNVPDDFEAVSMHSGTLNHDSFQNPWEVYLSTGGQDLHHRSDGNNVTNTSLPRLTGHHTLTSKSINLSTVQLDVIIECVLQPEFRLRWQLGIYDKIMEVYEKRLADYEKSLAEFEKNRQVRYQQNPFLLLQNIKEQLKQAAIASISCQFFDGMDAMKHAVEPCGFPQPDLPEAEREGVFIRFFEQAFEWKLINFIFYPYFWGRKCTWEDKINQEADNILFQKFLSAGAARLSIPVRPGFEGHVNWFLKTRQIWGETGEPPVAGPDFVPIYQEMKEDKENFNSDREGYLDVVNNSDTVTLHATHYYWNPGNPLAKPNPIPPYPDEDKFALDRGREIYIDCKRYRIVDIQLLGGSNTWTITLERPYEGATAGNLPWSTGALFVGAPWEYRVPTRLVWLREEARCLPCYPIECAN